MPPEDPFAIAPGLDLPLAERRQPGLDRPPPGRPEDVGEEEDAHGRRLLERQRLGRVEQPVTVAPGQTVALYDEADVTVLGAGTAT